MGNRTDGLTISGVTETDDPSARFGETSPLRLLPFGIPQLLVVGSMDNPWRIEITDNYVEAATTAGDEATLMVLDGANHFDVTDPRGPMLEILGRAIGTIVKR